MNRRIFMKAANAAALASPAVILTTAATAKELPPPADRCYIDLGSGLTIPQFDSLVMNHGNPQEKEFAGRKRSDTLTESQWLEIVRIVRKREQDWYAAFMELACGIDRSDYVTLKKSCENIGFARQIHKGVPDLRWESAK